MLRFSRFFFFMRSKFIETRNPSGVQMVPWIFLNRVLLSYFLASCKSHVYFILFSWSRNGRMKGDWTMIAYFYLIFHSLSLFFLTKCAQLTNVISILEKYSLCMHV